ncbi:MAG TPA: glycosyltransferase family 39 protein [Chthoniobacterales bacterium]|nr:glycosyltransferase family 39 protein [Chthoniobacterales bacterium]
MMPVLWLLLYLVALFLTGHVIVSLIFRGEPRSLTECLASVAPVGAGVLSLILFWVSLAGFSPGRITLVLIVIIFGAGQFQLTRNHRWHWTTTRPSTPVSLWAWTCAIGCDAIIAGCVAIVAIHAVAQPIYEFDAFAIWALKAKVLAHESLRPRPEYFSDPAFSFSHQSYPLLVPFIIAGVYGAIGETNEYLGKSVFLILYLAFVFQIFTALRWKLNRSASLLLTTLAVSLPPVLRWAGAGTADFVLTVYYAGAIFYFLKWLETERRSDLVMLILYSGFMAFTKNEGFAAMLLIAGVMLVFAVFARSKSKLASFGLFAAGILLLQFPWLWWGASLPHTDENYGARLRPNVLIQNLDRVGAILAEFCRRTLNWSRWSGFWFLFPLVAILGFAG